MNINLKSLLTRLNTKCQSILLERALRLSASRGNYNIDVEHWVHEIVAMTDMDDLDWKRILKHYAVDVGKLTRQLTKSLDKLEQYPERFCRIDNRKLTEELRAVLGNLTARQITIAWL